MQIQAYLDNIFDVGALLEDTETKNAVLEHMEDLQEQVGHVRALGHQPGQAGSEEPFLLRAAAGADLRMGRKTLPCAQRLCDLRAGGIPGLLLQAPSCFGPRCSRFRPTGVAREQGLHATCGSIGPGALTLAASALAPPLSPGVSHGLGLLSQEFSQPLPAGGGTLGPFSWAGGSQRGLLASGLCHLQLPSSLGMLGACAQAHPSWGTG